MKNNFTDFEKEYFIQTRKDIDSEKLVRERMFNYSILLFNAHIAIYGILNEFDISGLTLNAFSFTFFIMLMLSISGLFYARHRKLVQIAHRWVILQSMLIKTFGEEYASRTLESRVMTSFTSKGYLLKDKILGLSLLIPTYMLFLIHCSYSTPLLNIIAVMIVSLHMILFWFFLFQKIKIGPKIYPEEAP